ncbi:YdcF family protein [Thermostichus vulcanus]|uniref:YdcF family protein n=1 Tax=Thermostichus vulcanus str. 'Rupite' TaxID=2813851 RepID=A0ABT0C6G6_THEVL|nr:YdcF family protein [Thermostichus vulcanus]MCJ2541363.1 YdcF family protein [Thermostichus vulcanus str. 'Rupite']
MFDLYHCEREPLPWLGLKANLSQMLTQPLGMVPLLLLIVLAVVWLVPPARRRLGLFLSSLPLWLYLVLLTPAGNGILTWGLTTWIPRDALAPADAIVVLGRGEALASGRVEEAYRLWQAGWAPRIFVSGAGDAGPMGRALLALGVPRSDLNGEDCSQTTEENAQFSLALLEPAQVQSILLITDNIHMLRSELTFRSFGIRVIPIISETYSSRGFPLPALREYLGLLSYGLKGRFFARSIPDLQTLGFGWEGIPISSQPSIPDSRINSRPEAHYTIAVPEELSS